MKKFLLTLFVVTLLGLEAKATIKTAIANGNWDDPAVWFPAGVPVCGDTVVIPAPLLVTIAVNVNLNDPTDALCPLVRISVAGRLNFEKGKKIRLVDGACVTVEWGGSVHPSELGGGKSEGIVIGNDTWWKSSDGVLNGLAAMGCSTMMPVELAAYSIQTVDDHVEINFTTASERDLDYFLIECSRDGSYYQLVGMVDATGNSSSQRHYSLTDKNPFNGTSYYRLKYVNLDGSMSVLEIMPNEFYALKYLLYPVPVNKLMFLEGPKLDEAKIEVLNGLGEWVEVEFSVESGKAQFNFEPLKSGVYFITIETKNTKKTERVVVVHK